MKLELVVMDWAGTAVDFGSIAPILALESVFKAHGVDVSRTMLRQSMGLAKRDHIREVLAIPAIIEQWQTLYGKHPDEADVDGLHAQFTPRMMDEIMPSSVLIPGVAEFADTLRSRGMKLGATTGYTPPMMERLMLGAAKYGYAPDLSLCPEDVGGGRPHPWMCYRIGIELKVPALWAAVKIGDTESDIQEGLNAGMWTIGVTTTGNGVGLSHAEWLSLSAAQQSGLRRVAEHRLLEVGAHFVVDSAAHALPLLDEIDLMLAGGERP